MREVADSMLGAGKVAPILAIALAACGAEPVQPRAPDAGYDGILTLPEQDADAPSPDRRGDSGIPRAGNGAADRTDAGEASADAAADARTSDRVDPEPDCLHGVDVYCACDTVFGMGCTMDEAIMRSAPCYVAPETANQQRDDFICIGRMISGQTTGNQCAEVYQTCGLL